ncbi:putative B3 domain-containing protein At5g66980 isoform X1 [Papaver somniferum]|nr:putative B3 domain-containing protein At5g66980 isoform X1 [Papaver somniferum]
MIPYDSILRSPSGCWNVKVREEKDGGLSFWKGWPDFAEAHCLQAGDFVTMKYIGNSQFVVTLYGNNGCEKVSSPTGSNGVKSIPSRKRKECGETSKRQFTNSGSGFDQHKYHAGDTGGDSLSSGKKKCELFKCDARKRKATVIEGRTGANQTECSLA